MTPGCAALKELASDSSQSAATTQPDDAAATQPTTQPQSGLDAAVQTTHNGAQLVQNVSGVADKAGVPWAGIVNLVAGAVVAGTGTYLQQKKKRKDEHKQTFTEWFLEGEPGATPPMTALAKKFGINLPQLPGGTS